MGQQYVITRWLEFTNYNNGSQRGWSEYVIRSEPYLTDMVGGVSDDRGRLSPFGNGGVEIRETDISLATEADIENYPRAEIPKNAARYTPAQMEAKIESRDGMKFPRGK